MTQIKKLSDCISPLSWLFMSLAGLIPMIVLLRPSVLEFVIMFTVDTIAFLLNQKLEGRLFKILYPETAIYFDGLEVETVKRMSGPERVQLFESFMKFPRQRAFFLYSESFLKVIPGILVIVFFWQHARSNWAQALIIFGIACLNFCYFYGAVFIEAHSYLSNLISNLHQKLNLSDVFDKVQTPDRSRDFEIHEIINMTFIILFMIILQLTLIYSNTGSNTWSNSTLALELTAIGLVGIILCCRVWYLGRSYFMSGLENLFRQMKDLNYQKPQSILPLHTSPILAQFEKTYNHLNLRLRASEQELASLIVQEADKSRYRTIGEMSALIAHDLSGPLHAAQFCATELFENPDNPKQQVYIHRIYENIKRAMELIYSLRARLKNPESRRHSSSIVEAHHHVLKLLGLQFLNSGFHKIQFHLDPDVAHLIFEIPSVDLIHILDNLYRNSVANMLDHEIKSPMIHVKLYSRTEKYVSLLIQDNGTGLSASRFEELTAMKVNPALKGGVREGRGGALTPPLYPPGNYPSLKGGVSLGSMKTAEPLGGCLGLRLIRRLVELNNGELVVLDNPEDQGTTFKLTLRLADQMAKERVTINEDELSYLDSRR